MAEMRPDEYVSIILDGMDQNKTDLPHYVKWNNPNVGTNSCHIRTKEYMNKSIIYHKIKVYLEIIWKCKMLNIIFKQNYSNTCKYICPNSVQTNFDVEGKKINHWSFVAQRCRLMNNKLWTTDWSCEYFVDVMVVWLNVGCLTSSGKYCMHIQDENKFKYIL